MSISGSFPVELLRAFDHVYMLICGIEILDIIDHFHKWRPLLHSFVFMLIRPTALVLKQIFF